MKILIVDDDRSRSNSLSEYLISQNIISPEGIHKSTCFDDAVEKLSLFHYDVLILDVVLPKRDNESADSKWAFSLLNKINRSKRIWRPSKIIGITGYLEDLGRFRSRFEEFCLAVIEANRKTPGWKKRLAEYIGYDYRAQADKRLAKNNLNVITIHGIRTFGHWQNRLCKIANENLADLPFHSFRYGYLSFLALFSRKAHDKYIKDLREKLISIFSQNPSSKFILFAHSYGTFLILETLRQLDGENISVPIKDLVLAGSVLKSSTDLTFLTKKGVRVINDCAHSDYVLWASEAFVPGLGMAGKSGFYGFENALLINRFILGGHSQYFEGDDFMKTQWLPIIAGSEDVKAFDMRASSILHNDLLEELVVTIGKVKEQIATKLRGIKYLIGGA
jgi:CheY-like chemotaxis protein